MPRSMPLWERAMGTGQWRVQYGYRGKKCVTLPLPKGAKGMQGKIRTLSTAIPKKGIQ